ncbi:RibD family protein [Aureimonas phyllosphaerae]|uniref:RibD family protein n=1 Tax=Aureimonas phyllosphaerae TaxID=1166078 RepID=UPI003A5C1B48
MIVARLSDEAWAALLALRSGEATAFDPGDDPAWAIYEPLARRRGGRFVLAQVGQSLDGRVATVDGDAAPISGPDGFVHLHRLRALADAVVVGAGCVVADDPRLTVREVAGPSPVRVVIDPNGRVPLDARCLSEAGRTILVRAEGSMAPTAVETIHLPPAADGRLCAIALLAALSERGLQHVLVEGGAATIRNFLEAEVVDRLHICVAPLIIGSGAPGLSLAPISRLTEALRPKTRTVALGSDVLFDCAFERR